MPVNIAPSVIPEYTASIPAPLDGDFATAASLQALVLPVANRVEFLRQGIDSDPWRRVVYHEDFARAALDGAVLSADMVWSLVQNTPVLFVSLSSTASADSFGTAVFQNSSGSALNAHLLPAAGALQPGSFQEIETLAWRGQVHNISTGMALEVGAFSNTINGVDQATGDGVSWSFNAANSPNWRFRTVQGGSHTYIDSGVAVADNTIYSLRIDQPAPGTWVGRILGIGSTFTAVSTLPGQTTAAGHQIKWTTPNAGTDRWVRMDYFYARYGLPGRVF